MGKQGVHAGLIFLIVKDEFCLVVFLLNRIVAAYLDAPKGGTVRHHSITKDCIISGIGDAEQGRRRNNRD